MKLANFPHWGDTPGAAVGWLGALTRITTFKENTSSNLITKILSTHANSYF